MGNLQLKSVVNVSTSKVDILYDATPDALHNVNWAYTNLDVVVSRSDLRTTCPIP